MLLGIPSENPFSTASTQTGLRAYTAAASDLPLTCLGGRSDMMKRRMFLGGALSALGARGSKAQSTAPLSQHPVMQTPPEPLVWPVVTKLQPGIRSFAGHTDTVPD